MFNKMLHIEEGFQTSVNISYDLQDEVKVSRFIPTNSAIDVIEDIFLSTVPTSTQRSRMLIGAYGRGKSHIILVLLALLNVKNKGVFSSLMTKIKGTNEELHRFINDYLNSNRKILPVVISGSSASLTQSFMNALQQTLVREGLDDIMPETHFQAAINTIEGWEINYPETYEKFTSKIDISIAEYIASLKSYDVNAYDNFLDIYPQLTSGRAFNPFLGFDVVEIYEKVNQEICSRGFEGMYVVYDEFSKYLESSITSASISDIKLLQDFAEKCNRSGKKQMHLLLISHKDISNYIDGNLPKEKVDGWRGVSGRFKHIDLQDNFSQIYEIIGSVIKKDVSLWNDFKNRYSIKFEELSFRFASFNLFDTKDSNEVRDIIENTYPLHPISTFVLPRISEKVAQNERTLFTYMSANEKYSLPSFLEDNISGFQLISCDSIYDYFEPLLRKEVYTSETYGIYKLTSRALAKLDANSLEAKVVKVLALYYIVGQYEKIAPTVDMVVEALRDSVDDTKDIIDAIDVLLKRECIVYLRRSNNFLKIKESSGVDVPSEINKKMAQLSASKSADEILNDVARDLYLYPTRYNDEHDVVRYFDFRFINAKNFIDGHNVAFDLDNTDADGIVYAILAQNSNELKALRTQIKTKGSISNRAVYILPRSVTTIYDIVLEYAAVKELKSLLVDDDVLSDEYSIYMEDLSEVIDKFLLSYLMPERNKSDYYISGKKLSLNRKAQFSAKLSEICEEAFPYTPVINNEAINKNYLPVVAINSRSKIIAGLLTEPMDKNLGLVGSGQEVSIMRSVLIRTKILQDAETSPYICLETPDDNINKVLATIRSFFVSAAKKDSACFEELYHMLTDASFGFGIKKGIIPIFIAVVVRELRQSITILYGKKEVKITADLFNGINDNPSKYFVRIDEWNAEKDEYIKGLATIFSDYIAESTYSFDNTNLIVNAMSRWYLSLPKYSKELVEVYYGGEDHSFKPVSKSKRKFINALKQVDINPHQFLFEDIFEIFGMSGFNLDVLDIIKSTKSEYDNAVDSLVEVLKGDLRVVFGCSNKHSSMISCLRDWSENLNPEIFDHLFSNNENKILELFKIASNDEKQMIQRLAKAVVYLRIEDWSSNTILSFIESLKTFKTTVEAQNLKIASGSSSITNSYKLTFVSDSGVESTRVIEKVEYSRKAILLRNEIETALDEMGHSISEQEKRQVLIEILESLC